MTRHAIRTRVTRVAVTTVLVAAVVGVATPALAVPFLGTVTVTTAPTAPDDYFRYADAYCPFPTVNLGGGAAVLGDVKAKHGVHIDVLAPGWDISALQGSAKEHNVGFSGSWSVRVTGICGLPTGWEYVQAQQDIPPGDLSGSVTATCPRSKKVIGAGGGTGKNPSFKLTSIDPSSDLRSVTVKTMSPGPAAFEHHVSAMAICIDPVPGQQLVTASSATNGQDKAVMVACPAGTKVHGVGGGLTGTGGLAHITRLDNWGQARTNSVILEAANSGGGNLITGWTAHVHAICAA
jgi:hypothetical protein